MKLLITPYCLAISSHGSVDESRRELLGTFGTFHGLIRILNTPRWRGALAIGQRVRGIVAEAQSGLSEDKTVVVAGRRCGRCNPRLFFQRSIS